MSKLSIALINLYYEITQQGVLILDSIFEDEDLYQYIQEIKDSVSKEDFRIFNTINQLITEGNEISTIKEYFSSVEIKSDELNIFFQYLFDWMSAMYSTKFSNPKFQIPFRNKVRKLKKAFKLKGRLSILIDNFKFKIQYLFA